MPRATRVLKASERGSGAVLDTLILPYAQRQAQKGFLFGIKGTCVELDLAEPVRLKTDDALLLDDGGLVEVVAEPEPLIEARAENTKALARLAWHLGDRHVPVQVLERRLRVRREPAVEDLLAMLGAKLVPIEAPFEPEGGAYEHAQGHSHGHEHHHHHHHESHGHHHEHHHDGDADHHHDHHGEPHSHDRKPG
jgi:urease accessory protein